MDGYTYVVEPVSVMRAAAILPAVGAYDTPDVLACVGQETVTLYVRYLRAGVGGAVDILIEASPYSADANTLGTLIWSYLAVEQLGAFAAGADNVSALQRKGPITYTSTGAAAETFTFTLTLDRNVERIRVSVAESGAVGTPGNCEIVAYQDRG